MTLNAADMYSIAEKMRLWEPTTKIRMKTDPYRQPQNCSPMTLLSGDVNKVYADIRGVPWGGAPGLII